MTHRTAMYIVAGLAAFMSAGPVIAGSTLAPLLPSLHFVEENELPTRARTNPQSACQHIEKATNPVAKDCSRLNHHATKTQKMRQKK